MKNFSDDVLVSLYAAGNNEAFDELLSRYKDKLYAYIYLVVQNKDLADDIFQDTFTRVIITIREGKYNEQGKFLGFLFRVAHNLVIDVYRQEQNAQFVSSGEAGYDLFNDRKLSDPSAEDNLSEQQTAVDIRRLVRNLPDSQKEIVQMRYYRGLSFKQIAAMKHISINTALGRMHYAILNMRKMAERHHFSFT